MANSIQWTSSFTGLCQCFVYLGSGTQSHQSGWCIAGAEYFWVACQKSNLKQCFYTQIHDYNSVECNCSALDPSQCISTCQAAGGSSFCDQFYPSAPSSSGSIPPTSGHGNAHGPRGRKAYGPRTGWMIVLAVICTMRISNLFST